MFRFRHYVILNTPDGYRLDVDHRVSFFTQMMTLLIGFLLNYYIQDICFVKFRWKGLKFG